MTEPIAVIDVDTHVTEPVDLWTSRLPRKYKDDAPHVEWHAACQRDRWHAGRHVLLGVQDQAHAGWKEFYPSTPGSFQEADPGGWDSSERLQVMDAHGIEAQILYPTARCQDLGEPLAQSRCRASYQRHLTVEICREVWKVESRIDCHVRRVVVRSGDGR